MMFLSFYCLVSVGVRAWECCIPSHVCIVFCVHFSGVCVWLHLMEVYFSLLICDWDV